MYIIITVKYKVLNLEILTKATLMRIVSPSNNDRS